MTATSGFHGTLMDNVYRYQRHIYDATRRNYLLGRDRLISELSPPIGGTVLEVGCGTGRNLIALAKRYPSARFCGIDISSEMLKTARSAIARHGVYDRITLAEADALALDPRELFGRNGFDRIFFSYTLSMIPDWAGALRHAASLLNPGGRLQIVDFGACEAMPAQFRGLLYWWLSRFHVEPRLDLEPALKSLATSPEKVKIDTLYRGYALAGVLTA
ncbi:MAG: class I SAM-dependent methyltransferase [Hyphomicrobiales bacterium]